MRNYRSICDTVRDVLEESNKPKDYGYSVPMTPVYDIEDEIAGVPEKTKQPEKSNRCKTLDAIKKHRDAQAKTKVIDNP